VVLVLPLTSAVASFFDLRELLLLVFFLLGLAVFIVLPDMDSAVRDNFFVLVTLSVSLSLLMSATLTSDNLHGYDIHQEYSIFLQVMRSGKWNPESGLLYNSALSISVLPTILSVVSGLDGIRIFMLVFPVIFSIVPVILYKIYRLFIRAEAAFLSVFLLMSYSAFYGEMVTLARQEVAEVLLALLLWFSLSSGGATSKRSGAVVTIVLGLGLIVSHYSLAYVYIVILFLSALTSLISPRSARSRNVIWALLFSIISLEWYSLTSGGTVFVDLVGFLSLTVRQLVSDFLDPAARPRVIMQAIGLSSVTPGLLHDVYRLTNYVVVAMLVLGFVSFLRKRRKNTTEEAFLPPMTTGWFFLMCAVAVPSFAAGLNLSRFYQIALLLISPCFVYGTESVRHLFRKISASSWHTIPRIGHPHFKGLILPASILMCYLLFSSGWVWAVSMDIPTSFVLDRERIRTYPNVLLQVDYYSEYSVSSDIEGARWLGSHMAYDHDLCADYASRYHVLNSYGEFPREGPVLPWGCDFSSSYVFLSALNTLYGIGTYFGTTWSTSLIAPSLGDKDRIYSNGLTVIYE